MLTDSLGRPMLPVVSEKQMELRRARVLSYDFAKEFDLSCDDPWGLRDRPRTAYEWKKMESEYAQQAVDKVSQNKSIFPRFVDSFRSTKHLVYAPRTFAQPSVVRMGRTRNSSYNA